MQLQGGCFYSIRVEYVKRPNQKSESFSLNITFLASSTFVCNIRSINAQQNIYSIQKKIPVIFGLRKLPEYENCLNTNTNSIWFQKVTRIRIQILVFGLKYSNNIRIPNYSLTSALTTLQKNA